MDSFLCNTKILSDVQILVQKQPVFYTRTCFPAPLWIMCINIFQFYKRIHLNNFQLLQALKISLLLYVLASKAPAWIAMSVNEHTQDLKPLSERHRFTWHWYYIILGLRAAERQGETEPRNLKWLKSKKIRQAQLQSVKGEITSIFLKADP